MFVDALGRPLNPVTVRKRFKQARDAIGARPLRFHDLRHTYGSLLAAAGVDLVTIKETMGHSALSTTGRYLHARPASEQAAVFTRVFAGNGFRRRDPNLRSTPALRSLRSRARRAARILLTGCLSRGRPAALRQRRVGMAERSRSSLSRYSRETRRPGHDSSVAIALVPSRTAGSVESDRTH